MFLNTNFPYWRIEDMIRSHINMTRKIMVNEIEAFEICRTISTPENEHGHREVYRADGDKFSSVKIIDENGEDWFATISCLVSMK